MAPNLIRGDKVLVYLHASLDIGSPAVCRNPQDPSKQVLGRILGKPGDRVEIKRSAFYLNGNQSEVSSEGEYVLVDDRKTEAPQTVKLINQIETVGMMRYHILWPEKGSRLSRRRQMREKGIDEGEYFLLADNRAFGEDSRVYGNVEISSCIGLPLLVYQPGASSGDAGRGFRWFAIVR